MVVAPSLQQLLGGLVGQAAHEAAAHPGDLGGIQAQVLLLRHANGHGTEILHKKGELDVARDHVHKADVLFGDMAMIWWSGQTRELHQRIDGEHIFKGFAPVLNN